MRVRLDAKGDRMPNDIADRAPIKAPLHDSFGVGFLFNDAAALQQRVDRLGVIGKQTVIDHVLIISCQPGQGTILIKVQLEPAVDRGMVVDDITVRILFCKKTRL